MAPGSQPGPSIPCVSARSGLKPYTAIHVWTGGSRNPFVSEKLQLTSSFWTEACFARVRVALRVKTGCGEFFAMNLSLDLHRLGILMKEPRCPWGVFLGTPVLRGRRPSSDALVALLRGHKTLKEGSLLIGPKA